MQIRIDLGSKDSPGKQQVKSMLRPQAPNMSHDLIGCVPGYLCFSSLKPIFSWILLCPGFKCSTDVLK